MARICIDAVWYDTETQEEELNKKVYEFMEDNYTDDEFDQALDDCYPEVEIAGMTYLVSDILKNCDPVAYRCMRNDELDSMSREYCDDIEGFARDQGLDYESDKE